MKFLSGILTLMMFAVGFVYAQPDTTPIWGYDLQQSLVIPNRVWWSSDSTSLYFMPDEIDRRILRYDIALGRIEEVITDRSTLTLSSEQQAYFHARDPVGYIAPNADMFVYVSTYQGHSLGEGGYDPYLYAVGNLSDQTFLPTRVQAISEGRIRWSEDSTAFLIEYGTPYGGQEAITYVKSTPSACSWNFCAFAEAWLTSMDIGETVYDFSPDGQRILYPDFSGQLRLWDVKQDAYFGEIKNIGMVLPFENVIGAAFVEDTADSILIVSSTGIEQYDLETKKLTLVNQQINSNRSSWAMFSPDNQWVAALVGEGLDRKQLFVLSVIPD